MVAELVGLPLEHQAEAQAVAERVAVAWEVEPSDVEVMVVEGTAAVGMEGEG